MALDDALRDLGVQQEQYAELLADFHELAEDHNSLVLEVVRKRSDLFTRRSPTTTETRSGGRAAPLPRSSSAAPHLKRIPEPGKEYIQSVEISDRF